MAEVEQQLNGRRLPARLAGSKPPPSREDWESGTVVAERSAEPTLDRPRMYKIILLNDDYTTKEFVVHVLMRFFSMDVEKAWQVMNAVHTTGSATAGIFPSDIAQTKSEQVNAYAQENQFPLRSIVEQTD